ncbi:hypothetical protein MUK42_19561 [Musa troglodytarum]|uniref:Uncharacterized protein n=1 Tax=Musa troglodytarum TaxID=320322 RepID=A0A9E7F9E4_9LILI|nr:hypothetical protein MUK42_19561 [Musa troglodytarum]
MKRDSNSTGSYKIDHEVHKVILVIHHPDRDNPRLMHDGDRTLSSGKGKEQQQRHLTLVASLKSPPDVVVGLAEAQDGNGETDGKVAQVRGEDAGNDGDPDLPLPGLGKVDLVVPDAKLRRRRSRAWGRSEEIMSALWR